MIETLKLDGQKEYEVSFWLTSEEDISEIGNILASANTTIISKTPLASIKLAYPIKKHNSAFFGSCIFIGLPENLKQIDKALASSHKVLRNLIITPPPKVNAREPRSSPEVASRENVIPESPLRSVVDTSVLSNEGLEKKLEEILK